MQIIYVKCHKYCWYYYAKIFLCKMRSGFFSINFGPSVACLPFSSYVKFIITFPYVCAHLSLVCDGHLGFHSRLPEVAKIMKRKFKQWWSTIPPIRYWSRLVTSLRFMFWNLEIIKKKYILIIYNYLFHVSHC